MKHHEEIKQDLLCCFKNGNDQCDGTWCQGCWKDIVSKVIKKLDELSLSPSNEQEKKPIEGWISVKERLPICFEAGNWDGKRSEYVLVRSKTLLPTSAVLYSGFIDGSEFNQFYLPNDFEVNDAEEWMPLP